VAGVKPSQGQATRAPYSSRRRQGAPWNTRRADHVAGSLKPSDAALALDHPRGHKADKPFPLIPRSHRMKRIASLSLAAALCAAPAFADEGMWTYNNFPSAKVKARYGFEPSKEWLNHLQLASVRIAGGCSASVVSP